MLHSFTHPTKHIPLPDKFTYPFHYTPHPLCILAMDELQAYIETKTEWAEELNQGKMLGVLVVEMLGTPALPAEIRYLAAFSGNLAGTNHHPYFVPPVFDMLQQDGFFKQEEQGISDINHRIESLLQAPAYIACRKTLAHETTLAGQALAAQKALLQAGKKDRENRRMESPSESELSRMVRQSQHEKAEYKRLERYWKNRLEEVQKDLDLLTHEIETLKTQRKKQSAALQQKLFNRFRFLNSCGEEKDLCTIFEQTPHKTPPAGAGECCAPKLLQYAFRHGLKPIAMAECWWGVSPKTEIRHHGHFYPACKGKCEPILGHMLQGLELDENPLLLAGLHHQTLDILLEDDTLLVINKPAGLLSVPGKAKGNSVQQLVQHLYPEATGPLVVHRLDMATSGLLLIAKTKEAHKHLQAQFKNRSIKKRYVAILDGVIAKDSGTIDLPLATDYHHRPRQLVDMEQGKPATTQWKVLSRTDTQTRIEFQPITGRTHQLRIHAAHPLGLNCPIFGDELYGKKATRLHLHAAYLQFLHPVSGELISVEKEAEF